VKRTPAALELGGIVRNDKQTSSGTGPIAEFVDRSVASGGRHQSAEGCHAPGVIRVIGVKRARVGPLPVRPGARDPRLEDMERGAVQWLIS
jgi:hypothetical protein